MWGGAGWGGGWGKGNNVRQERGCDVEIWESERIVKAVGKGKFCFVVFWKLFCDLCLSLLRFLKT